MAKKPPVDHKKNRSIAWNSYMQISLFRLLKNTGVHHLAKLRDEDGEMVCKNSFLEKLFLNNTTQWWFLNLKISHSGNQRMCSMKNKVFVKYAVWIGFLYFKRSFLTLWHPLFTIWKPRPRGNVDKLVDWFPYHKHTRY